MLKELNIEGVLYQIIWSDIPMVDDGKEHWAILDAENRTLTMYRGLSEHDLRHLLTHEIVHEIINLMGDSPNGGEEFVKLFSRLFFDSLDRNGIFTRKIK